MLDVYEYREGTFEVVDSQMQELRAKRVLYYKLVRFVIGLLIVIDATIIFMAFATDNFLWLLVLIIPSSLAIYAYRSLETLKDKLGVQISSIVLEFDRSKQLTEFRVRKWRPTRIDEFFEEEIRYNQAVGFKVIWYDNGFFDIQIIVDVEFPGTNIFGTHDFFLLAEFRELFSVATPSLDTWIYELEDGSAWPDESLQELVDEMKVAKIPWTVREYFTEL